MSSTATTSGINHSSLRHVNGVAVHQEADSLEGRGAFMVSAKVTATPREVFCVSHTTIPLPFHGL